VNRPRTIALVAALACAAAARADDVADARLYYREGTQLYSEGKYRAAITAFENAYRKKPHGAIQYNLAQCREKLGEWPAALRGYHDYLRESPEATDRPAVLATIRRIEEKLAATGVQVLLVYSEPLGAEVRIDGRPRGTTPFHIVLPPGSYGVSVAREGYVQATREVVVLQRGTQLVDEKLRPAAAVQVPLPPPPVGGAPSITVPPPASPDLAPRPPTAGPLRNAPTARPARPAARGGRTWTWVAGGVSAAALVAAGYYTLDARSKSRELRDGKGRNTAENDALVDGVDASVRNSRILYGVAAAAGAAGTTLFFVEGRF
jgi:hypothetical protein